MPGLAPMQREQVGDALHSFILHPGEEACCEFLPPNHLWACSGSVLQGDHGGVEIGTAAHETWLKEFGLLSDSSRLTASTCLGPDKSLQGLVIDDFFAASVEDVATDESHSQAAGWYDASQRAYKEADLLWSPFIKDEVGGNEGKLIGAYVNSS